MCVRPMATGLPSVLMLMRRAAAFAKMSPTFPVNARVECRAFVSERILVGLRWHAEKAAVFLGFPMSLDEKKT